MHDCVVNEHNTSCSFTLVGQVWHAIEIIADSVKTIIIVFAKMILGFVI